MKKRILSIILCFAAIVSIFVIVPDSDAGVASLNITNQTKTISAGKSFQIKLNGLKSSKVKWSSSKPSVATVSKKGLVNGVSAGKTVITGKYKGIKFKINVKVKAKSKSNTDINKTYTYKDTVLKLKEIKYVKDYSGKRMCQFTFDFTNNSGKATYFEDPYECYVYINGIEVYADDYENIWTNVKDGATLEGYVAYSVKSGDKIEFELSNYYTNKTVYKTSFVVP